MPKVFISYSHDSDEHRQRVLDLSDRLNRNGLDCEIDQYLNGTPELGWPLWMEQMLEAADYVLVVCTETYLQRVQRTEKPGTGKGVKWESLLTYQDIYDNDSANRKFVPITFCKEDTHFIPKPLRPVSSYDLSRENSYQMLYRYLTGQPLAVKPGADGKLILPQGNIQKVSKAIQIDRLPTVDGRFFGREAELQMLDEALEGNDTRILQFIASGGTGKTKLLRHWLNLHLDTIPNYLIWSFYSQGSSDSKQVSVSPLITEAFKAIGVDGEQYATDEDRVDALAELLIEHQCLLVLDGLEPMQHGGKGFVLGQLKDRALKRLLQTLAQQHSSLCIITSRLPVHDLKDRQHVTQHELDNLSTVDGVKLLRALKVQGRQCELETAVEEVEGHALTLHLLGNALTTYLDSDIRKRDTLDELIDEYGAQGRHAFKVMQGYQRWLTDEKGQPGAELQCLYLLGLFDHPVEQTVLQVLWDKTIPGLTAGIPAKAWKVAIRNLLDQHRLLSAHGERPELLDCHPLIREYFGKQLKQRRPEAWREAHEILYHYYKSIPDKDQPDSVEEMQPLFYAVAHGCAASLHQQVFGEVYWPRIRGNGNTYLLTKLGGYSDDLAVAAHFFSQPWCVPAAGLGNAEKAGVLNWAGFSLRALGRLDEAVEPMNANIELNTKWGNWRSAAANASNLSELQLSLGQVAAAVDSGKRSVAYADQSQDIFYRMVNHATHADALHQGGQSKKALELFETAEQLQREHNPKYRRLYSLAGFQYCNLLLAKGRVGEVLEHYQQWVKLRQAGDPLLDRSLEYLVFGRTHHALDNLPKAHKQLDQAVANLRKSGLQQYLPYGLLARAALCRDLGKCELAQRDLDEVWEIAEPSGMRLHLTDYHLEMTRLLLANPPCSPFDKGGDDSVNAPEANRKVLPLAKGETEGIGYHLSEAERLIKETGYHRRDGELGELLKQLESHKQ